MPSLDWWFRGTVMYQTLNAARYLNIYTTHIYIAIIHSITDTINQFVWQVERLLNLGAHQHVHRILWSTLNVFIKTVLCQSMLCQINPTNYYYSMLHICYTWFEMLIVIISCTSHFSCLIWIKPFKVFTDNIKILCSIAISRLC